MQEGITHATSLQDADKANKMLILLPVTITMLAINYNTVLLQAIFPHCYYSHQSTFGSGNKSTATTHQALLGD
jgi:hypothetical protein